MKRVLAGACIGAALLATSCETSGERFSIGTTNLSLSLPSQQNPAPASATGSHQLRISWASPSANTQGVELEQSTDGVAFEQIQQLPASTTSALVTGLSGNTTYYFRVRSYNQAGSSAYTPVVNATTPADKGATSSSPTPTHP